MLRVRRGLRAAVHSPVPRLAGTLIGVAILLHTLDIGRAARSLRQADPRLTLLGVALTGLSLLASVVEWGVLLRGTGHRLSWRALGSWYLQGLFVGQMLPAGVGGDALRAVEIGRLTGHGNALASLAGSRMAGTLGMALWGVAGAVLLRAWLGPLMVAGACLFAAAMIVAWILALGADHVVRRLGTGRARLRRRVASSLAPFTGAFRGYRRRPNVLLQSLLVGAAGWGMNLCALAVFARALGIDAGWSLFAVAIPVTLVATLAPFSLNGLGLREGVLAGMLVRAGVSGGHVGAMAILVDLQMVPFALAGAVVWARCRRGRPPIPGLAATTG